MKFTMKKVIEYISESFGELKSNVTWPSWAEVQKLTVIVAIFSITFSLATYGVDMVFERTLGVFFTWLNKV